MNPHYHDDDDEDDVMMTMPPPERPQFRSVAVPARAPMLLAKNAATTEGKTTTNTTTIGKETTTPSPSPPKKTWCGPLRRLPSMYPLERGHVTFPRPRLTAVLERLTDAFYELDCDVVTAYETETLGVACRALHGNVEFQVNMFEKPSPDDTTIVMEMQRVAGDSWTFTQRYAKPLLRMVRDDRETVELSSPQTTPTRGVRAVPPPPPPHEDKTAKTKKDDITDALDIVTDMIVVRGDHHDKRHHHDADALVLGLESLVSLTDAHVTGDKAARTVAQAVVESQSALGEALTRLLLDTSLSQHQYATVLRIWTQIWETLVSTTKAPRDALPSSAVRDRLQATLLHHDAHAATWAWRARTALDALDPDGGGRMVMPPPTAPPPTAALARATRPYHPPMTATVSVGRG